MKIITGKTMTCHTCDTTYEYDDNDLIKIPAYPCMSQIICPKCGQVTILVAEDHKPANVEVVVMEEKMSNTGDSDNENT